jgi:hypothetical protein
MRPEVWRTSHALIAILVAAATIGYLAFLPHNLGIADESYLLNDARRIRNGDVMYRDIFYFTTPIGHWLLAAAFWLFGTTMTVARTTMAVVHGCIAALAFLVCRRLAVPIAMGLAVSAATVVLCHSAWPHASLHWFSLLFMVALAYAAVGRWWTARPRRAAALGVLTGLLIAVQQHKGAVMGLGVLALIAMLAAVEWRAGAPRVARVAARRALWFAAGAAGVLVPMFAVLVAEVGIDPLVEQLVVFPFAGYQVIAGSTSWGRVMPLNAGMARYTMPDVLTYQPLVLPILAVRCAALWIHRATDPRLPPRLGLLAMAGAAALSTVYWADFIHIAYIAPLCFVAWVETATAVVDRLLHNAALRQVVLTAVGVALLVVLVLRARINWGIAWQDFPVAHQTAFGRVDFGTSGEAELVDRVRGLLAAANSHSFFAYPMYTSLYLTTGSDNPTRWQLMAPGYVSPAHYDSAIQALEQRQVPYLLACVVWPDTIDPMLRYIATHFERLDPSTPPCALYRRREIPDEQR